MGGHAERRVLSQLEGIDLGIRLKFGFGQDPVHQAHVIRLFSVVDTGSEQDLSGIGRADHMD